MNDLILNREKWNIGYSLEINFSIKTNIMIRDNPPKINKNIIKILDIMLEKFSIFPMTIRLEWWQQ